MFKLRSITDYFKPATQPRQNKRPPPDDDNEKARVARRSRSNTPRGTDRVLQTNASEDASAGDAAQAEQTPGGHLNGSMLPSRSPRCESTNNISTASTETRREKIEPRASPGPVLTSSQRVVRNGEVMIRNSDDESDSSLDDIDDLLARKSAMIPSPSNEPEAGLPPSANQRDRQSGASTRSRTRGAGPTRAQHSPSSLVQRPRYEFSLDSLERHSKDDRAVEADAAKARTLLDSIEIQKGTAQNDSNSQVKTGSKVDATLLVSIMKKNSSEEDDIERLRTALIRTEAFDQGNRWSFFDDLHRSSSAEQAKIPIPQDTQWQGILNDTMFQQQAFLSGYIGDMASKGSVPDEILLWIVDAVCFETRDDLRSSYIYTLEAAQDRITAILTPNVINSLLQNIGASTEGVDIRRSINPMVNLLQDKQDRDQSKLLSILNLISRVSRHLSVSSRKHAICILCRLSLDISVVKNCETNAAIEEAFLSLVEGIPEEDIDQEIQALSALIYPFVQDSTLRLQMLRNIPASSCRLSLLRRRLSMVFFFDDETFLRKNDEDLVDMKLIARRLRKPLFKIRNDTDYPELAALITILSIGIESGDRPPESDKLEKVAFNADVDLLTRRIHEMFAHIVDTGASHMKRTEAKEVLEAFQSQLLYAIRTTPKAKKGLFDDSTAERALMKGFLGKRAVE